MFLDGTLKRSDWLKKKSLGIVLRMQGNSFLHFKEINEIATNCVSKSTGQSTGSYETWFNREYEKDILVKMQWINAMQILHQIC